MNIPDKIPEVDSNKIMEKLIETPGFNLFDFMNCFTLFDKPSSELNDEQRKLRIKCISMAIQIISDDKIPLKNMNPDAKNPNYMKNMILRQLRLNLQEASCIKQDKDSKIDMYLWSFLAIIVIIVVSGLAYHYYYKK